MARGSGPGLLFDSGYNNEPVRPIPRRGGYAEWLLASSQRSASIAAMQPLPAAVTAWR